jgi:hypothetical protein
MCVATKWLDVFLCVGICMRRLEMVVPSDIEEWMNIGVLTCRGTPWGPKFGGRLLRESSMCAGARVKVMRSAGVGPVVPFSCAGRQAFDGGIGLNLDLNGAGLSPVVPSPFENVNCLYFFVHLLYIFCTF